MESRRFLFRGSKDCLTLPLPHETKDQPSSNVNTSYHQPTLTIISSTILNHHQPSSTITNSNIHLVDWTPALFIITPMGPTPRGSTLARQPAEMWPMVDPYLDVQLRLVVQRPGDSPVEGLVVEIPLFGRFYTPPSQLIYSNYHMIYKVKNTPSQVVALGTSEPWTVSMYEIYCYHILSLLWMLGGC